LLQTTLPREGSESREVGMPVKKLQEFLDQHQVKYVTISHSPAYTAQEVAASAHIPGKEVAKTVMVKLDGRLAMAVLPASSQVNFARLKNAAGVSQADYAPGAAVAEMVQAILRDEKRVLPCSAYL